MSKKSSVDISEIRRLMEVEGLSTYKIADKLSISQAHVFRLVKKWNTNNPNNPIKLRSKSEAQKTFLEKNGHQRVGTTHSEESRTKMSDAIGAFYESPDGAKAKEKIADAKREEWASFDDTEKKQIMDEMRAGISEANRSGEGGSKFENFIADGLEAAGFLLERRTRKWLGKDGLEIDIALPNNRLAIEIDGPTHWQPIHGQEQLLKVQAKDKRKDSLLMTGGWDILRVRDDSGSLSAIRLKRVINKIKEIADLRGKKQSGSLFIIEP